jgi:hypothetical protein
MIQDYIAYLIISAAFGTFLYRFLGFFNLVGKKTVKSGNCAGCTTGCEMKHSQHFFANKKGKSKQSQYQYYL